MLTENSTFPAAMVAACEAAIDAGVFYQDQFAEFVVDHMGGYGCDAVRVKAMEVDLDVPGAERLTMRSLRQEIITLPRGHYALVKKTMGSRAQSFYKIVIADGYGDLATGCAFDHYDSEPSEEKILARMVGYEIYLCRKQVEHRRVVDRDRQVFADLGMSVGMKLRDYRVPGEKPFSTAIITEVYPDTGRFKLELIRRGTAKRRDATVGASVLADRVKGIPTSAVKLAA